MFKGRRGGRWSTQKQQSPAGKAYTWCCYLNAAAAISTFCHNLYRFADYTRMLAVLLLMRFQRRSVLYCSPCCPCCCCTCCCSCRLCRRRCCAAAAADLLCCLLLGWLREVLGISHAWRPPYRVVETTLQAQCDSEKQQHSILSQRHQCTKCCSGPTAGCCCNQLAKAFRPHFSSWCAAAVQAVLLRCVCTRTGRCMIWQLCAQTIPGTRQRPAHLVCLLLRLLLLPCARRTSRGECTAAAPPAHLVLC